MKMKPFSFAISMALVFCALTGCEQEKTQPSTVCNDDGTVTFYYDNPNAKDVQVDVQFAGRRYGTSVPATHHLTRLRLRGHHFSHEGTRRPGSTAADRTRRKAVGDAEG